MSGSVGFREMSDLFGKKEKGREWERSGGGGWDSEP